MAFVLQDHLDHLDHRGHLGHLGHQGHKGHWDSLVLLARRDLKVTKAKGETKDYKELVDLRAAKVSQGLLEREI